MSQWSYRPAHTVVYNTLKSTFVNTDTESVVLKSQLRLEILLNWASGRAGPEASEPDRPAEAGGGGEEEEGGRGGRREGEAKVSDSI